MKEGTLDATSWQGKAGEGNYQALPLERVYAGTAVTVKYNGTKLVKSVKAKKKAKAAAEATAEDKGKLIGADGNIYADVAPGTTAVAKICYVSGSNGLALALTDEGKMNWSTAISTCAAHRPAIPGGTWKLATEDEWRNMITAAGGYTALRDGFSGITGASNLKSDYYWSSTEYDSDNAYFYHFDNDLWYYDYKTRDYFWVRACLAFGAGSGPDPIELTSTDGETWTLASMPDYDVELEVTYYPTHAITVKEGTLDATSWQGKAGEGNYQALPLERVYAGTALSVKYNGTKKVKSVKAKGKPLSSATAEAKGKLIGADGNIYDTKDEAEDAGITAVAKIIYIGPTGHATYNHGLALALTDEGGG
jgi:DNA-binding protein YbaB